MELIAIAAIVISFIAIFEYIFGQMKHYSTYFFWFLIIVGCMYMTKAYRNDNLISPPLSKEKGADA